MQRSQIVILAVASLLHSSSASWAPNTEAQGSAVAPSPANCGAEEFACSKCEAFIATMIQGQLEAFQTELQEVCNQVPETNYTRLSTGKTTLAPEACMQDGTDELVSGGEEDVVALHEKCVDQVNEHAGGAAAGLTEVGASMKEWKKAVAPQLADEFVKQASGILDNLAQEWGVQFEPTETPVTSSSDDEATPPRLFITNMVRSKMAALKKAQKSQRRTTNLILGAGAFVLFSLVVVGVRKSVSRPARQVNVELEEGLDESSLETSLE